MFAFVDCSRTWSERSHTIESRQEALTTAEQLLLSHHLYNVIVVHQITIEWSLLNSYADGDYIFWTRRELMQSSRGTCRLNQRRTTVSRNLTYDTKDLLTGDPFKVLPVQLQR